jgi:hypothetical protein
MPSARVLRFWNNKQSSRWAPVLRPKTSKTLFRPVNVVQTSTFFSFYLELYTNKLKNLIRTSNCKFSIRGLKQDSQNRLILKLFKQTSIHRWTFIVLLVLGRRTGAHREDCLLFQKRVMGAKLYIYVCITGFQNKYARYIKNVNTEMQPRLWSVKDIPHTTPPVYLPADSIS